MSKALWCVLWYVVWPPAHCHLCAVRGPIAPKRAVKAWRGDKRLWRCSHSGKGGAGAAPSMAAAQRLVTK